MSNYTQYPSKFQIGDPVNLVLGPNTIPGWVRTVTFTNGKVRYSMMTTTNGVIPTEPSDMPVDINFTSLHNIDSAFIESRDGMSLELDFDNYS